MSFNNAGGAVVAGSLAGGAAEYVRMLTEHQQYSTENQRDRIGDYATRRGFEIVRTYADEGKSGLRIDGHRALQNLISDVTNGKADFCIILVYDVSRWGRFQDATRARITSTSAAVPASRLRTAPSSSKTTGHLSRPSSKESSGQWLVSTAANCRRRFSRASAV